MTRILAVFAAVLIASLPAGAAESFTGGGYAITPPDGWVRIPQDVVQTTMQKVMDGKNATTVDAVFQLQGRPWFSYPYVMVQTIPYPGQPNESQMKEIIRQMTGPGFMDKSKGNITPQVQKILDSNSMTISELDTSSHTSNAFHQQVVEPFGKITGMMNSHFGSRGMVNINSYAREDDFTKYMPQFSQINNSFQWNSGEEYQGKKPFNKDRILGRIGAYGLIAIIVGVVVGVMRKKKTA
ncbi:MAG TPA: hypothetical protein VGQ99_12570 [Tepidisphaeraceae bacterium]|jgi:hypothetical protein|nr:hypothetical protein [Tepidisphaeraceae bacterium]HEV8606198.1 hypothetical protein [Tepidisphaeraceae bacterium]